MFGLGFLAPAFLAALAAVTVPIVLHLYHRRTDRVVDFPAAGMLPEAPVAQQERRRLRDLLLLALRAAALVLLAVSFARPYLQRDEAGVTAGITIVAVDVSLSTSAPSTWAAVQRAALAEVEGAPAVDLVGVVAFDDRGRLAAAPGAARDAARDAVRALTPGAGGTSYPAAVGAAVDALRGARGRIVVVTDLQARGWAGAGNVVVPGGVDVAVAAVPPAPANLAVTAVRHDGAVTAVVQNFAAGPRTAVATLRVDGRETARATASLGPLAAAELRFPATLPALGAAAITIDDPDGFQGDNARYWRLEPARPRQVVVLTADPPESAPTGIYVQRALEAAADEWPVTVTVLDGARYAADPRAERPDAVVVVGTRTLDRRGRARLSAYLRDGGHVLLSLGPDLDVPTLAEAIGLPLRVAPEPSPPGSPEAAIVVADRRHPVWRQLAGTRSALGRVPIDRFRPVLDESGWEVLARFTGGPMAFGERVVGQGTLLLFASDLDNRWNRFPLEPGFAPFIVESGRYLTRGATAGTAFVLPDVPPGVPPTPGHHRLATTGQPDREVVVNVDPAESDPAVTTVDVFSARVTPTGAPAAAAFDDDARAREEQQRLWQIGLAVMLALLVAESLIGRVRRPATSARSG